MIAGGNTATGRLRTWCSPGNAAGGPLRAAIFRRGRASAYLHEKVGDQLIAAGLYADAARSAPNLAERDHHTRQAARINQALRG